MHPLENNNARDDWDYLHNCLMQAAISRPQNKNKYNGI
eukprot:Gb_19283 [translate_table: standard]